MKIKSILAAIAVATVALLAASCTKTDTAKDAGGYYVEVITSSEYGGIDAQVQLEFNSALAKAFSGIVYKTADNDKKAIAACDPVWEKYKSVATLPFQLYFQNAVAEGEKPTKTVIKKYALLK